MTDPKTGESRIERTLPELRCGREAGAVVAVDMIDFSPADRS